MASERSKRKFHDSAYRGMNASSNHSEWDQPLEMILSGSFSVSPKRKLNGRRASPCSDERKCIRWIMKMLLFPKQSKHFHM